MNIHGEKVDVFPHEIIELFWSGMCVDDIAKYVQNVEGG